MTEQNPPANVDDTWFVAEAKFQGLPIVLRARQNLKQMAGHPDYPLKLTIRWVFRHADENGFPSPEDQGATASFEERLLPLLERETTAILTVVVTHDGTRDWIFYTGNVAACEHLINGEFTGPALPLEFTVEEEPQWDEYLAVLEALEQ